MIKIIMFFVSNMTYFVKLSLLPFLSQGGPYTSALSIQCLKRARTGSVQRSGGAIR